MFDKPESGDCTWEWEVSGTVNVKNCGGVNYSTTIVKSCTKTAPNCADAAHSAAAISWKDAIVAAHCPVKTIDWID